jgi:hypothetical protein
MRKLRLVSGRLTEWGGRRWAEVVECSEGKFAMVNFGVKFSVVSLVCARCDWA